MTPQREEAERLLRLARRDEAAFVALLAAPSVALAVACFHAQQAVEKALKAVMCLCGLEFRRTHDLEALADKLADAGLAVPATDEDLRRLTPYAVEFRYDDEAIPLLSGEEARRILDQVLAWAEQCIQEDQ